MDDPNINENGEKVLTLRNWSVRPGPEPDEPQEIKPALSFQTREVEPGIHLYTLEGERQQLLDMANDILAALETDVGTPQISIPPEMQN